MTDHWIAWGENVPGRPADWPALTVTPPERARELGRWLKESASKMSSVGQHELAEQQSRQADAFLAMAEAIENDDRDAWLEALAAEARASGLTTGTS